MDDADRAQIEIERAEAAALARRLTPPPARLSFERCIDCDATIPQDRRDAIPGVRRCVDCEELHELRLRGSTRW